LSLRELFPEYDIRRLHEFGQVVENARDYQPHGQHTVVRRAIGRGRSGPLI
jgi:hypothetical protein